MTSFDIAKAVSAALGQDEAQARKVLDSFAELALKEVAQGNSVSLFEMGTLAPQSEAPAESARALKGEDVIARIADATGVGKDVAAQHWTAVFEQAKNSLLQGNAVAFDRIGSLRIRTDRAKVEKDERTGTRLLSHPRRSLALEPAKPAGDVVLPAFGFKPLEGFVELLQFSGGASILLAFPDIDWFAKTIDFHFQRAGWKTQSSQGVVDAVQKLEAGATHLVMIDAEVKGYQRLCEAVKRHRGLSMIPLVVLFPRNFNLDSPSEFMICGDEHVVQPFEVKKLLSIADAELARSLEEESIFEQQVLFQFPTDDTSVERANEFAHKLFETSGLKEEDVDKMSAAIREAIGNGCQHGNRYRRDKKIESLFLLDKDKVTVMVKDQGQGFDHEKYVKRGRAGDPVHAARERHKEGKLGGLGIMLMLRCTDKLEYNDIGNSITLTKFLHGPEPVEAKSA